MGCPFSSRRGQSLRPRWSGCKVPSLLQEGPAESWPPQDRAMVPSFGQKQLGSQTPLEPWRCPLSSPEGHGVLAFAGANVGVSSLCQNGLGSHPLLSGHGGCFICQVSQECGLRWSGHPALELTQGPFTPPGGAMVLAPTGVCTVSVLHMEGSRFHRLQKWAQGLLPPTGGVEVLALAGGSPWSPKSSGKGQPLLEWLLHPIPPPGGAVVPSPAGAGVGSPNSARRAWCPTLGGISGFPLSSRQG